jgi:hypothetical protein
MTRDGCLIVVHQIQVLCFFMSQQAAVDYVFRDYVFTGNALTSHDLCTYSVLIFLSFMAL